MALNLLIESRKSQQITFLLLMALPIAVILLVPVSFVPLESGYLDAFIYTSYISDYGTLIERYGPTYYSARISHIVPAKILIEIFGTDYGYYVFKYLLLLLLSATAYFFGKEQGGRSAGLLIAGFSAGFPAFVSSLSSDHYDGTAAVYLASAAYMLMRKRASGTAHFFGGALLALAAGAQIFLVVVGAAGFIGWFVLRFSDFRDGLRKFGFFGLGVLSGLSIYLLTLRVLWGDSFGSSPTVSMIKWLFAGGSRNWDEPLSEQVVSGAPVLLVAIIFVMLGVIYLISKRRSGNLENDVTRQFFALTASYVSVVTLYIAIVVVFGGKLFSLYYYNIYLYAFALPLGAFSLRIIDAESRAKKILFSFGVVVTIAFICFLLRDKYEYVNYNPLAIGPLLLAGLVLLSVFSMLHYFRSSFSLVLLASIWVFAFLLPIQSPGVALGLSDPEGGRDLRAAVMQLREDVDRDFPTASVGFVYPPKDQALNSLQSAYLWGYSKMIPAGAGLTSDDPSVVSAASRFSAYVVLGRSKADIKEGADWIEDVVGSSSFSLSLIREGFSRKTDDGRWGYHYKFFKKIPAPPTVGPFNEISLADIKTLSSAASVNTRSDGGAAFVTDPANGGYSFFLPLAASFEPYRLWVSIEVVKGSVIGMVVTAADDTNDWVGRETQVFPDNGESVVLEVPKSDRPLGLLIRNGSGSGASKATLKFVRKFKD